MKPLLGLLSTTLLLVACNGPAYNEVGSAEGPMESTCTEGTTCPAGDECFAPELCPTEDVVCPAGPDCFAPEICAGEERVLGAGE
jgi:hypothetical protein